MARARKTIYFELLVTVGFMVIPSFMRAVQAFLNPGESLESPGQATWHFASMIVVELLLLGLLWHILRLNGETIGGLTEPFAGKDVLRGFGLALWAYGSYYLAAIVLWRLTGGLSSGEQARRSMDVFKTEFTVFYLLSMLVNPFCEEFFVRGFLQTRLRQAGHDGLTVILVSVALQASYHLYQGAMVCLALGFSFLVFALYYNANRRLWPVVIAHLIMDVIAMLSYMKRA
jgi:membrane protease YdiL (CAAX protease family)